jgi:vacuolar-type H+-ATPase subunit F/Vma7
LPGLWYTFDVSRIVSPLKLALIFLTKNVTSTIKVEASACVEFPLLLTVPNCPKNTGEEPVYGAIPDVTFKPEKTKEEIYRMVSNWTPQ